VAAQRAAVVDPGAPHARPASPRRAEIVDVAARLFSERGYHGTSMQHMAEALGLLRGSLYAHIGSKEEILFEVVDRGAERFLERARSAVGIEADAPTRLTALLVGHIETAIEHLEAATVFLNEWRYLSSERRDLIQQKRDDYENLIRSVIEDGIQNNELRADLDVALTARLVLSAGNWTYTWYRPGGPLTPTQVGHAFAETLIRGLAPVDEIKEEA
jgi:TetR/AcrR family transcriptional regulator, cholesterol catabolism regulator